MFRFIFKNGLLLNKICSKVLTKILRETVGLQKTTVVCKDVTVDSIDDDWCIVHLNCDAKVKKEELINLIDQKLG